MSPSLSLKPPHPQLPPLSPPPQLSFSPPLPPSFSVPPSILPRDFDLIIFSETSFVGYFTIRELLITLESEQKTFPEYAHLKWAIAGRNKEKMDKVIQRLLQEEDDIFGNFAKKALQEVTMIVADVEDPESLINMARKTILLINTVGPYLLYGRPVVEACLSAKTHYIDLSAEAQFIEQLQIDFDARAQEDGGICIVNCCGWGSVPVDLGVAYLKEAFTSTGNQLASVEVHVDVRPGPAGYKVHTGTFDSMLTVFVKYRDLRAIRRNLFSDTDEKAPLPATVPYVGPKLKQKLIKFPNIFCKSSSPSPNYLEVFFPGPDMAVVKRSQHYNYRHFEGELPVRVTQYIRVRPVANQIFGLPLVGLLFWHRPGRWLLKKQVEIFTAGFISRKGPSKGQIESTDCGFELVGRGYSLDSLKDSTKKNLKKPDKWMKLKIECNEPAYLATSTFLVQSALSLLFDSEYIPRKGVLTSASAFQRTKLIERLKNRGVTFKLENF